MNICNFNKVSNEVPDSSNFADNFLNIAEEKNIDLCKANESVNNESLSSNQEVLILMLLKKKFNKFV